MVSPESATTSAEQANGGPSLDIATEAVSDSAATTETGTDLVVDQSQENGALTSAEMETLLQQAMAHYNKDQLMAAARLLRQVPLEKLPKKERSILELANDAETVVTVLRSDVAAMDGKDKDKDKDANKSEWTKLSDNSGSGTYNSILHYRVDESTMHMTVRIDCPLPQDLLIPLLAVLNETSLYRTWLPQFTTPRLCFSRSELIAQLTRGWQIFVVTCAVPWPFATRECVISALAWEDIADENYIGVRMRHVDQPSDVGRDNVADAHLVPPPPPLVSSSQEQQEEVVRIGFQGGILFRKCPADHPTLQRPSSLSSWWGGEANSAESEAHSRVLTSVIMKFDPKVTSVPQFLINFVLRTVFGTVWYMLLQVAISVRDGKRPAHTAAVEAKRKVLYDWMEERIHTLLNAFSDEGKQKENTGTSVNADSKS